MASNIITEQELMEAWGIKQRCKLIEYLNSRSIPFDVTPKGKIWTVHEALIQTIIRTQTSRPDWRDEEFA
jgi:hypothetical protein